VPIDRIDSAMNTAVEFGDELIGGCASTVLSAIEFQFVTSFACAAVGSASASNAPTTASLSRVTFMPTSSGPSACVERHTTLRRARFGV
jgi:hypothetical protein